MASQRIIIIGGVAGGMSAATRLRRLLEGAEIVVLERGGHVSFANCGLPYYLIVHCKVGQRGHTAVRLLAQLGREAVNLDGGYLTWSAGVASRREQIPLAVS